MLFEILFGADKLLYFAVFMAISLGAPGDLLGVSWGSPGFPGLAVAAMSMAAVAQPPTVKWPTCDLTVASRDCRCPCCCCCLCLCLALGRRSH